MATDRQRIEQARVLIVQKEYQKARRLLVGINHPTAHRWIAKIDELDPRPAAPSSPRRWWTIGRWVLMGVLLVVLAVVVIQMNQPANPGAAEARRAAHERCTEQANEANALGADWGDAYNACMSNAAP